MNKSEFKSRFLNEDKVLPRADFISFINSKLDVDAESFLEELIDEELVMTFGPNFIGYGERVGDHNYVELAANEYLPLDKLVINRSSALFLQDQMYNYSPEQLQFASSEPIDLPNAFNEIFDIQVLPADQLKGIERKTIYGVEFLIFSKTRLLFQAFAPEESYYKAVCNYVRTNPDFDPAAIKQLGSELGQMKEAETILACLNSIVVPLDRSAIGPRISEEALFERTANSDSKEFYSLLRSFYAQLPPVYDLNEVRKLGISMGRKAEADLIFHCLQSIRESRNLY